MGIIYKAENLTNGKVYIGKTVYYLNYRKSQHESDAKRKASSHFHKSLLKYGFDNFEWSVLTECDDRNKLNYIEKLYIAVYKKTNILYNLTNGGDGRDGSKASEETRKKMSEMRKGEKNANYGNHPIPWNKGLKGAQVGHMKGKHHSEETKKKISENHARAWKGRTHSEESKIKMSESRKKYWEEKRKLNEIAS